MYYILRWKLLRRCELINSIKLYIKQLLMNHLKIVQREKRTGTLTRDYRLGINQTVNITNAARDWK